MFRLIVKAAVYALVFAVWFTYLSPIIQPILVEKLRGEFYANFLSVFSLFVFASILAWFVDRGMTRRE